MIGGLVNLAVALGALLGVGLLVGGVIILMYLWLARRALGRR